MMIVIQSTDCFFQQKKGSPTKTNKQTSLGVPCGSESNHIGTYGMIWFENRIGTRWIAKIIILNAGVGCSSTQQCQVWKCRSVKIELLNAGQWMGGISQQYGSSEQTHVKYIHICIVFIFMYWYWIDYWVSILELDIFMVPSYQLPLPASSLKPFHQELLYTAAIHLLYSDAVIQNTQHRH